MWTSNWNAFDFAEAKLFRQVEQPLLFCRYSNSSVSKLSGCISSNKASIDIFLISEKLWKSSVCSINYFYTLLTKNIAVRLRVLFTISSFPSCSHSLNACDWRVHNSVYRQNTVRVRLTGVSKKILIWVQIAHEEIICQDVFGGDGTSHELSYLFGFFQIVHLKLSVLRCHCNHYREFWCVDLTIARYGQISIDRWQWIN